MTLAELQTRLEALEKTVEQLRAQLAKPPIRTGRWWHDGAGRFANDPVFDEIVRLGREYRESLHPDRRKKKPAKRSRKNGHS